MSWIQKQLKKDEGFTLIELMVVVLIIAILIAIAIPTFLGARERAQDRAAQSDLRNGLSAAKVLYTDDESFAGADEDALKAIEPSLTFTDAVGTDDTTSVGFVVEHVSGSDSQRITLWKQSASGKWFGITETARSGTDIEAGTTYGAGTTGDDVNTAADNSFPDWAAAVAAMDD